eukprot:CAMPEP_0182845166 /NCGR_PEP_ID=MMETSP0006_2-20121128/27176_1 /TAXON_ID=97485 /ORGANISM="Prymnesium parvum, Strain Texoma1" /LENGTH=125 /DNA_ID=CAMNT_0024975207 /DNA_START=101 /DNA_END=478 /DNA_ORIENTATION=-
MSDNEAQKIIEANIKRNLGVFSVPRYLCEGDPFEKRVGKNGTPRFTTSPMADWWRQNIAKECLPPPSSAPARTVMDAHPRYAAQWAGEPRQLSKLQPPPPLLYGIASAQHAPASAIPVFCKLVSA